MVSGVYYYVNIDIFFERWMMSNFYLFIYFMLFYSVVIKIENVNNIILLCLQCNNNKLFIMYFKFGGFFDYFFLFLQELWGFFVLRRKKNKLLIYLQLYWNCIYL